jgi:hypothetical protein
MKNDDAGIDISGNQLLDDKAASEDRIANEAVDPVGGGFETAAFEGQNAEDDSSSSGLTRRQMIKITAGAVAAAPLLSPGLTALARPRGGESADGAITQKAPLFFTPEEFALLDELTDIIIPTDDHSPGARAAEVAAYIDARVAESWEPETKEMWRNGLKLVDELSKSTNGTGFMQASPQQRIEVVGKIAKSEMQGSAPEGQFFRTLKGTTARGYYTSKIGIHTEMEYKGNTYQNEFSGYDAT